MAPFSRVGASVKPGAIQVPPERLFESPFIDINEQGPTAVFSLAQFTRIKTVLDEIRARAVA